MFVPYAETEDGFESHFQVNYLSHFLLTQLLHEALVRGATKSGRNSRVVNVSSCASFGGNIDFADLQLKWVNCFLDFWIHQCRSFVTRFHVICRRNYSKFNAYMVTKFLQVIFSQTADRKYREQGVPIHSYSLHPGVVKTELYDNVMWLQLFRCLLPYMFKVNIRNSIDMSQIEVTTVILISPGMITDPCRRRRYGLLRCAVTWHRKWRRALLGKQSKYTT